MLIFILLNSISQAWAKFAYPHPMISEKNFQGDITGFKFDQDRLVINHDAYRWPNGIIYYDIAPELDGWTSLIKKAMDHIEDATNSCLTFEEKTTQSQYVHIYYGSNCESLIGRFPYGKQDLSIGKGCNSFAIIVHELLHAAGLWHEQTRWDRDDYVKVHFEYIDEMNIVNFKKFSKAMARIWTPFDMDSIMLYGSFSMTNTTGKPCITDLEGNLLPEIWDEEKNKMSETDVLKVKMLYKCDGVTRPPFSMY